MRKHAKTTWTGLLISLTFLLIFFILFFSSREEKKYITSDSIHPFSFVGTYQFSADGKSYPLDENAAIDCNEHDTLILKGHFSKSIAPYEQIFFRIANLSVTISVNDATVFEIGQSNELPTFSYSPGNIWSSLMSDGIQKEDAITIELHNLYEHNNSAAYHTFLASLCTGDKLTLLLTYLKKNAFFVLSFLIIFVLGMTLFVSSLLLLLANSPLRRELFYFSVYMIVTSLCMEIEYSYISLLVPYGVTTGIIETLLFLLFFPCLVRYIRLYLEKTKKIVAVCELISYLFIPVYIFLQFTHLCDGYPFQYFYDRVAFCGCAIVYLCLLYDCLTLRRPKTTYVFITINAAGIVAVFSYWYTLKDLNRPGYYFTACGIIFFIFIHFLFQVSYVRSDAILAQKAAALEQELTQSRICVLSAQIQPHFVFNSLASIKQLCKENPKKAMEAIDSFASFLRSNIDLMRDTTPISFQKELEFVKNYFYLEQMRYEDRIHIFYELSTIDFLIPPLTLQPIVENAVKYGISKREEGGNIWISTVEKEDWIEIIIKDDGVGFNTALTLSSDTSHVGIDNVKKRIEDICRGHFSITSEIGSGTLVIIQLPKFTQEEKGNENHSS